MSPIRPILLFACAPFLPSGVSALTLSGTQTEDVVIVPKGDHVLSGACEVPAGKKLEIKAGAIFTAEKGASLRVEGELVVSGDAASPVLMKGSKWAGVRTESTAKVSVKGLQVSGAEFALNIQGPTAKVEDCVFAKNVRGLKLDGSGEVVATNCLFVANAEYGLRFARMTGSIEHCTFFRNKGAGAILGEASPKFLYCQFNDNGTAGIEMGYDTDIEGAQCAFEGNGIAILTGKKGLISFRTCWWGSRTTTFIRAKGVAVAHPAIRSPQPETPKKKKKTETPSTLDPADTLRVSWEGFRSEAPEHCGATVVSRL